jgi:hypothetical protein
MEERERGEGEGGVEEASARVRVKEREFDLPKDVGGGGLVAEEEVEEVEEVEEEDEEAEGVTVMFAHNSDLSSLSSSEVLLLSPLPTTPPSLLCLSLLRTTICFSGLFGSELWEGGGEEEGKMALLEEGERTGEREGEDRED